MVRWSSAMSSGSLIGYQSRYVPVENGGTIERATDVQLSRFSNGVDEHDPAPFFGGRRALSAIQPSSCKTLSAGRGRTALSEQVRPGMQLVHDQPVLGSIRLRAIRGLRYRGAGQPHSRQPQQRDKDRVAPRCLG